MIEVFSGISKRLFFLTSLSLIGGVLFVPFIKANAPTSQQTSVFQLLIVFSLVSSVVVFLCSWIGLRVADKTRLEMPILNKWEKEDFISRFETKRLLIISVIAGIIFGFIASAFSNYLGIPNNQGNFMERISTTLFAAVVPEVVVHLFVMSSLLFLFKRIWIAIFVSSVLFAILHGSPSDVPVTVTIFIYSLNFTLSVLTGWLYSRFGFESAMLTHAMSHLIVVGIN